MTSQLVPSQPSTYLKYDQTLMYGQYQKLGEFGRQYDARSQPGDDSDEDDRPQTLRGYLYWIRDTMVIRLGDDWLFLTILGLLVAFMSFCMDWVIAFSTTARLWLYQEVAFSVGAQYFVWVAFPVIYICFSTGFVHLVNPTSIGSGIPEMKTIFRGVVLKEYLTFRTLVSKIVGLCGSLGCGLPIGKTGPFVHVACITANLLSKLVVHFRGIYEVESRRMEMLSAACAVGVAAALGSPIGGVLFSIEVTSTFFAVRNYWRGFYSAVLCAVVYRLLAVAAGEEQTLTAVFATNLRVEFPFSISELFVFAVLGVISGFIGALFVFVHRNVVLFIRHQKRVSKFLQRNRFIFPVTIVTLITTINFPLGFGKYCAGQLSNAKAVEQLFSNFTWCSKDFENRQQQDVLRNWTSPLDNVFTTLVLFTIVRFFTTIFAIILPVPAGVFLPTFTIGAGLGRLIGEMLAAWFPAGLSGHPIITAGYSIVGAATISGAATHTISTAVIAIEVTGQLSHVLPCVLSVLIANAVAHTLEISIYDSIILIKKLPFLPDLISSENAAMSHKIFVEDFMERDIKYITPGSAYGDVQYLLESYRFKSFPLLDSDDSRVLLGSLQRQDLELLLADFINKVKESYGRSKEAVKRNDSFVQIGRFVVSKVTRTFSEKKEHGDPETSAKPSAQLSDSAAKNHPDESSNSKTLPLPSPEVPKDLIQQWLNTTIDLEGCNIDPAPFQLVERTSLYKIHSLFSLLALHHCYITDKGRLMGMVGLKEVRLAVQGQVETAKSRDTKAKEIKKNIAENDNTNIQMEQETLLKKL